MVTPESTAHIDAVKRYEPLGATIIPFVPSQDEIVRQLIDHEIDAFGEGDVSNEYLSKNYIDENEDRLTILTDLHTMDQPEELRFVVRITDLRLLDRLNEFITDQKTNTA